jgi:hypothetical protein
MKISRILAVVCFLAGGAAQAADMAVTIYNSDLGVINETRQLEFKKGIGQLSFTDVPAQIDASSVRFELVNGGKNVTILEQNYAYDLVGPAQMYAKYIDKMIELVDEKGNVYRGTLLSYAEGAVIIRDESGRVKIVSLSKVVDVNFPVLPEGLITRPTLLWRYNSDVVGKVPCRVSYQTGGMNWTAEYVGVLNSAENQLGLSGWASITNNSGKTYQDAKLKLIAGSIHRASRGLESRWAAKGAPQMMAADGMASFEEKAFFEYHMYTLPRDATVTNKEQKQISLFDPAKGEVRKEYIYFPDQNPKNVSVVAKFKNSKETGLGMPLPAGRIRMFQADDDGTLILLGEDQIDHTPKDESLKVDIGTAFDIAAEQRTANITRISNTVEEREFEVELRNRKADSIVVTVEKNLWGFWEVIDSSLPYKKKDAGTISFQIPVKEDETVTLKLKVRFTTR